MQVFTPRKLAAASKLGHFPESRQLTVDRHLAGLAPRGSPTSAVTANLPHSLAEMHGPEGRLQGGAAPYLLSCTAVFRGTAMG